MTNCRSATLARLVLLTLLLAGPPTAGADELDERAPGPQPEPQAPVFFVEMEVDDPEPYVHGSVRLSVRLHAGEPFLEGGLSEPRAEGALVRRVGEDRIATREIDGRSYQVVEREYALAPQRSGSLRVEPVVFEGLVRDASASRRGRSRSSLIEQFFAGSPLADAFADPFFADPFGGGLLSQLGAPARSIRAATAPLELSVRPRPETAAGAWWLPARHVELLEHWESDPPVFRVGEPVRRHVILRADGVAADQLPPLALPEPEGLNQYAEPPRADTRVEAHGLRALQVVETVLIPTRAGAIELPAIEVSWWDTAADRARSARVPARSIQVLPGEALPADLASAPVPPTGAEVDAPSEPGRAWIVPVAAAVLLLLASGGAGLLLRRRRATGPPVTRRKAERALARACRRGDSAAAVSACRDLARLEGVEGSLADQAGRGRNDDLAAALRQLDRVRYAADGSGAEGWDGCTLWRAWRCRTRSRRRRGAAPVAILPALYPES